MRTGAKVIGLSVATMLAAACSGTSGGTPTTSAGTAPSTAPASDPSSTTAPTTAPVATTTTTTIPPPPTVPAGIQFGESTKLPVVPRVVAVEGDSWLLLSSVDSPLPNCPRGTGPCTRFAQNPVAYVGSPSAGFTSTVFDDLASYRKPAGFGHHNSGLVPVAATGGPGGWVVAANLNIWDSNLFHNVTVRSVLWHSADGVSWQRIDVRDIAGQQASTLINGVTYANGSYWAVGGIAQNQLFDGPSRGLALRSPDGVTWSVAAELPNAYATEVDSIQAFGDRLVATGFEYICTLDAGAFNDFSLGSQSRMWQSADDGITWTAVDVTTTGLIGEFKPVPPDPSQCGDFASRREHQYRVGFVAVAGDRVVVGSGDGSSVATSADLVTWVKAELPGASPSASSSRLAYTDDDGLVVVSPDRPRSAAGTSIESGQVNVGWRSTDGGTTWEALPTHRAVGNLDLGHFVLLDDGSVLQLLSATDAGGATSVSVSLSVAGPLEPDPACALKPGSNCQFVTVDGDDLSGASLAGIDFAGATLTGVDLSGADLAGASFAFATLRDVDLSGASLAAADLRGAVLLSATLGGTDLSGANLGKAMVPLEMFAGNTLTGALFEEATIKLEAPVPGASFAGLNLTGASFTSSAPLFDLRGADFSGALLPGVFFFKIDLTGANFTNAVFSDPATFRGVFFGSESVCPDGAAPDSAKSGQAACRL